MTGKRHQIKHWFLLFLLISAQPTLADHPPQPEDFAYGLSLAPQTTAPAYELELPTAVYEGVFRSDLGDIRVFNAAGEVVPHGFYQTPLETTKPVQVSVPFFPLPKTADEIDALSVSWQREAARTVIELSGGGRATPAPSLTGYLLDVRSIDRPIQGLLLDWNPASQGFLYKVTVAASDDLRHWRPRLKNASLADLSFAGHRLLQRQLSFAATRTRYLRLTLTEAQASLSLTKITAELASDTLGRPLRWVEIAVQPDPDKPGDYHLQAPGRVSVRKLRVELPQDNTFVKTMVHSRAEPKAKWRHRGQGLLYRLVIDDTTLKENTLAVTASAEPEWLLRFDQSGGGLGAGLPQVELGWYPHRLVFVARGESPFTLAYGSARIKATSTDTNALLKRIGRDSARNLVSQTIQVQDRLELGGRKVLQPPANPIDWKQWLLWLALVAGVLALAWMARRLLREVNGQQEATAASKPTSPHDKSVEKNHKA